LDILTRGGTANFGPSKGEKPANIPVMQTTKYKPAVINL
jgi:hypothetical protein